MAWFSYQHAALLQKWIKFRNIFDGVFADRMNSGLDWILKNGPTDISGRYVDTRMLYLAINTGGSNKQASTRRVANSMLRFIAETR